MTIAKWQWLARERRAFCAHLAEHGDPAAAARAIGKNLTDAYRQRDSMPGFAGEWQAALAVAWEQVETRVLAGLLAPAGDGGKAGLIDSRVALAVLARREAPKTVRGPLVDEAKVARFRDEIRALAVG